MLHSNFARCSVAKSVTSANLLSGAGECSNISRSLFTQLIQALDEEAQGRELSVLYHLYRQWHSCYKAVVNMEMLPL